MRQFIGEATREHEGRDVGARAAGGRRREGRMDELDLENLPRWRTGADCVILDVARALIPGIRVLGFT